VLKVYSNLFISKANSSSGDADDSPGILNQIWRGLTDRGPGRAGLYNMVPLWGEDFDQFAEDKWNKEQVGPYPYSTRRKSHPTLRDQFSPFYSRNRPGFGKGRALGLGDRGYRRPGGWISRLLKKVV